MGKPKENVTEVKVKMPTEEWIGRLTGLLRIVDTMDADERRAAFAFLRNKYSGEWPYSAE